MFKVGDKVTRIDDPNVSYCSKYGFNPGDVATVLWANDPYSLGVSVVKTGDTVFIDSKYLRLVPAPSTAKPFDAAANAASPVGLRFNEGKNRVELLCPTAMQGLAAVLTIGAKKYAANNWQKGMSWLSVTGCLLRHTFKFMSGEENDAETGLPHVDHILCNAMFLSNYHRHRREFDDRHKTVLTSDSDSAKVNK